MPYSGIDLVLQQSKILDAFYVKAKRAFETAKGPKMFTVIEICTLSSQVGVNRIERAKGLLLEKEPKKVSLYRVCVRDFVEKMGSIIAQTASVEMFSGYAEEPCREFFTKKKLSVAGMDCPQDLLPYVNGIYEIDEDTKADLAESTFGGTI